MGKDYCMESIVRLIVAIGLGYSCNRGYYTFLHEDGKIVYNLGKFFVGINILLYMGLWHSLYRFNIIYFSD